MDLAVAGIYGSSVFNVSILFYSDIFYRDGILMNQSEPAHFVAGGVALGLMVIGSLTTPDSYFLTARTWRA